MEYNVIRSKRKTLSLQIKDGKVIVRAPLYASGRTIENFVDANAGWIEKTLAKSREIAENRKAEIEKNCLLTEKDIYDLAQKAVEVVPGRVNYYAPIIGVKVGRITIRRQKSKWGSASAKGNLNFNCLLMLAPPEVLDSVVVHELCHLIEMNHSERFYRLVLSVMPDYYERQKWLKDNGNILMARAFPESSL